MNQFLSLNFMEPLKSILSGGWSIVTWISEWNRVEALAVGTPLAEQIRSLALLGEVSTPFLRSAE